MESYPIFASTSSWKDSFLCLEYIKKYSMFKDHKATLMKMEHIISIKEFWLWHITFYTKKNNHVEY